MLGFYANFPTNFHSVESFASILSAKKLQQKLIQVLRDVNRKPFRFEEVADPTVPNGSVIFEIGLAEDTNFNYIDEEETKKVLGKLRKGAFQLMDFFCVARYYKDAGEKKTPLKFDYYLVRFVFSQASVEIRVHHERGPRYISPRDLTAFLVDQINQASARKALKTVETESSQ
ncbi:MAG: hypothetical protein QXX34_04795 [Candidatus Bathyarchaeia archaeon]